jgi:Na+/H+ antiporter NhaD/arsenite permease-like protein
VKLFTLIIFIISYFFFIWKKDYRAQVCWIACAILFLLGVIRFSDIFTLINWNVLGIFWGTLVVAELFSLSGVPGYLANIVVVKAKYVNWAILSVCLVAGAISTFMENVATVLIIAPIALAISRKLRVSPVPFLISIALMSNLQGAATLVGDPPSIILAGFSEMNFNDFFFLSHRPSIFFAIQLAALVSTGVLYFVFRKNREPVVAMEKVVVTTWMPTFLLGFMILGLVAISFLRNSINHRLSVNLSGLVCVVFGFTALIWHEWAKLGVRKSNGEKLARVLFHDIKNLDWETFFFLAGIFVIVGSLTKAGIIDDLTGFFVRFVRENRLIAYLTIVWGSVLFSAFVDNVPYVLAMLPVVRSLALGMGGNPYLFYFGLLIGASVGGNITPIGASANVVACGILNRNNYAVDFIQFIRIGLPFTLFAVLASSTFIWLVWK